MQPQLQAIIDEFNAASDRLERLVETVPGERWVERPHEDRWSVSECVVHLNLTGAAFVSVLNPLIEEARREGMQAKGRYRRDLIGWLLWRTTGPPVRMRVPTAMPFMPQAVAPVPELVEEFNRLQEAQIACVRSGDGLALDRIRIRSPFNARVKYNVYSAMSVLPRHQHRHLWQAEQAATALDG